MFHSDARRLNKIPDDSINLIMVKYGMRNLAIMLMQIRGRFLLKLDNKTYELIRDILPDDRYKVEVNKAHEESEGQTEGQAVPYAGE